MLDFFRANPWVSIAGLSWLTAQVLKLVIEGIANKRLDLTRLIDTGGMPSSHTSLVTGLCTSIGLSEGWHSPLFAVCLVFSCIVVYDATNLRRNAGLQAQALNEIIPQLLHGKIVRENPNYKKLRELLGHSPLEVSMGALLGIVIALWLNGPLGS
jgi:acid phosphatase family membrane protein YuiD